MKCSRSYKEKTCFEIYCGFIELWGNSLIFYSASQDFHEFSENFSFYKSERIILFLGNFFKFPEDNIFVFWGRDGGWETGLLTNSPSTRFSGQLISENLSTLTSIKSAR